MSACFLIFSPVYAVVKQTPLFVFRITRNTYLKISVKYLSREHYDEMPCTGFEPSTSQSPDRRSNYRAMPSPITKHLKYIVYRQHFASANFSSLMITEPILLNPVNSAFWYATAANLLAIQGLTGQKLCFTWYL